MSTTLLPGPRLATSLAIAAGSGVLAETLLSPLDGSSTLKDLGAIATHQTRFELSVLIGLAATVLFIPVFLGLAQACAASSRRVATTAGWLLTGAMAGFVAIRLGQAVELAGVQTGADRRDLAATVDGAGSTAIGVPILVMFLGGAAVGLVLLAVAAWRAGMPKPACVLLAVFQPVDLVLPEHPFPLGSVSHALLLAAFGWIAYDVRVRRELSEREPVVVTA
jgi:hypothetical protein